MYVESKRVPHPRKEICMTTWPFQAQKVDWLGVSRKGKEIIKYVYLYFTFMKLSYHRKVFKFYLISNWSPRMYYEYKIKNDVSKVIGIEPSTIQDS